MRITPTYRLIRFDIHEAPYEVLQTGMTLKEAKLRSNAETHPCLNGWVYMFAKETDHEITP